MTLNLIGGVCEALAARGWCRRSDLVMRDDVRGAGSSHVWAANNPRDKRIMQDKVKVRRALVAAALPCPKPRAGVPKTHARGYLSAQGT